MSFLIIVIWKGVKKSFHWGINNATKFNMDFYLLPWIVIEHHRIFISNLNMSNILAEAEKSRLFNVFQAFAMDIYESLLTCL